MNVTPAQYAAVLELAQDAEMTGIYGDLIKALDRFAAANGGTFTAAGFVVGVEVEIRVVWGGEPLREA
ncbi:hypothetical protein [Paraburkholderia sp. MM6662-R1]|uniref:hypothetical protein n=1 Tax=Paraburkholderia sp. MM6662-R1 TaxID=2991066 RepID=UPI003D1B5848